MTLINKLIWFPLSLNYTESPWSPKSLQLPRRGTAALLHEPIPLSAAHNSQQLGDKAGVVWKKQQINDALAADSTQTVLLASKIQRGDNAKHFRKTDISPVTVSGWRPVRLGSKSLGLSFLRMRDIPNKTQPKPNIQNKKPIKLEQFLGVTYITLVCTRAPMCGCSHTFPGRYRMFPVPLKPCVSALMQQKAEQKQEPRASEKPLTLLPL